jgi:hypothetical protein
MLALTLDILIILLLLISLGAGLRLHGALKIFRVDGTEFQPLIQSLDKATTRAETTLGGMRKMAEDVGGKLTEETKTTQRLLDELDFMTKRADQMAEKLNTSISGARSAERKAEQTPPMIDTVKPDDIGMRSSELRRRAPDLEQRLNSLR